MALLTKTSLHIIAPSFKIPISDLNLCLSALKSINIEYYIQRPLFNSKELCSHTVDKRLKDLKRALVKKSDYIWCLRGGYGALHLVEALLDMTKPNYKAKLIGFSDITVLHYIFNQKWNRPSLHWKHLNGFLVSENKGQPRFNQKSFLKALQDLKTLTDYDLGLIKPLNSSAKNIKILNSKIIGGNLITLQSLVGLNIAKPKNKILFLEEIDEPIYKIDRALTQLKLNGWFDKLDGIVLGSFSHKNESTQKKIQLYLKQTFKNYKLPVFSGLKAGHIKDQKPLFFNTESSIRLDKNKYRLKVKNGFL